MNNVKKMDAFKRLTESFFERGYTGGDARCEYLESGQSILRMSEKQRYDYLRQHLHSDDNYIDYVKAHPNQFGRQFFMDMLTVNSDDALYFKNNIFEWMDEAFIDEELVMYAMIQIIANDLLIYRGRKDDWFYSVQRRKPELLSQDMYILGARCFATKQYGKNRFLEITPVEYRTKEYYRALCVSNDTPVMEDVPEEILTPEFLADILNEDLESVACFSEAALETEIGANGKKVWQYVFDTNYAVADKIPLNDERVEYFLSLYGKNSCEYEYFFKKHYKRYLRSKREKPVPNRSKDASVVEDVIMAVLFGCSAEKAIDAGTAASRAKTDRNASLPIYSRVWVPDAFAKELDKEEYLEAIYAQLGIQILGEASGYYYDVVLPEGFRISEDRYGYCLKDVGGNTLLHYFDRGPFYDRDVFVDAINVALRIPA